MENIVSPITVSMISTKNNFKEKEQAEEFGKNLVKTGKLIHIKKKK